jgi:hypothetical protein
MNKQGAAAIGYNLRIWNPVRFTDFGDMFPMGAEYHEIFFSHSLYLHILLPKSWSRGF